ncbi:MAG TPA: VTT domain-containing protein [Pseudonocardiaceae bacterium]
MDALPFQLGALPPLTVAVLVGVVMFIDASPGIGLLLPGDIIVVGVMSASGAGEALLAGLGVVLGTLLSWSLFFFMGNRVGPRLRRGRLGRWLGTRWDTAETLLRGRGARVFMLVQFLPVLNAIVPMVAGVLGMPYRLFLRYAVIGTVAWAVVFGAIGASAGLASDAVFDGSPFGVLLFGAPGFVAGWLILLYLRHELASRSRPSPASTDNVGAPC